MSYSFFGIPVTVRPVFWLFAGLIGYLSSGTLVGTLIWIGIIFISVLFHEMGHGLTALLCKKQPRIELVAFGGVTYYEGQNLPYYKQFLIVLNGPLFGFFLYLIAQILLLVPSLNSGNIGLLLQKFSFVNLFWSVVNLLPVFPLDGGQLLRIVLEAIFGFKGIRYAQFFGMLLAGVISILSFVISQFFLGALFFLLAFQCYEVWKKSRLFSEEDSSDALKELLQKAESELQLGHGESAREILETIRQKSHSGVIYSIATQYLGILLAKIGHTKEAYDLLLSIRSKLPPDAICLLHKLAFEEKDYKLVLDLSGKCYQFSADPEIALRNAFACGFLSEAKAAVGWLSAALRSGVQNIQEISQEKAFDLIRHEGIFQDFIQSH